MNELTWTVYTHQRGSVTVDLRPGRPAPTVSVHDNQLGTTTVLRFEDARSQALYLTRNGGPTWMVEGLNRGFDLALGIVIAWSDFEDVPVDGCPGCAARYGRPRTHDRRAHQVACAAAAIRSAATGTAGAQEATG